MKSILLAGAALALSATAFAADDHAMSDEEKLAHFLEKCEAGKPEGSTLDCTCLAEKAGEDEAVRADLKASLEGGETGEALKGAAMACSAE